MHIEWAVCCEAVSKGEHGYDLVTVGYNGVVATEDELPFDMPLRYLVCFRADPGDESGGRVYHWQTEVVGPDGTSLGSAPGGVRSQTDTSPQLIDPERHFLPFEIVLPVDSEGVYRIVLTDEVSQRYELPFRVNVLPRVGA
jgi:hypothetical protein